MENTIKPKFSIITPLYNTASYFNELTESMENQNIGFEESVQWILIDDGSDDGTGILCDEFKNKYPDNVIVIHQKNKGSAEARNAGIKIATGEYIGFLDADDMFSINTLKAIYNFFLINAGNVDIATVKIDYFEAKGGHDALAFKFGKSNKIIHLIEEYTKIQTSLVSVFAKSFLIKKLRFEDKSIFSDIPFLIKLISRRNNLGVVRKASYKKRIRFEENSQSQLAVKTKEYYTEFLEKTCLKILKDTEKLMGYIPSYIQFTVMHEIQWRIKENDFPDGLFTDEEKNKFFDVLKEVLSYIDDKIIINQKVIRHPHKSLIYYIKYGTVPMVDRRYENMMLHYKNSLLYSTAVFPVNINFIKIKNNNLTLEGVCSLPVSLIDETTNVYFKINNEKVPAVMSNRIVEHYSLGRKYMQGTSFRLDYDLKNIEETSAIKIYNTIFGDGVLKSGFNFARFSPVSRTFKNEYYYSDGYMVWSDKSKIMISQCSDEQLMARELALQTEMIKKNTVHPKPEKIHLNELENLQEENILSNYVIVNPVILPETIKSEDLQEENILSEEQIVSQDTESSDKIQDDIIIIKHKPYVRPECKLAVRMRHWYHYLKPKKQKQIWLVSDRVDRADDNGEAIFRYLINNAPENVDVYFIIDKNCDDYQRLKPLGNIVASCSKKHLMLHLLADYILSSQGNEWVENPFGSNSKYFRSLYHQPKYICLQHGITKDDQTKWLNRFNKDIYGLIASCKPEYDSFLTYPYYYTEKEIWLTGMPRYDLLYHNEKRYITIMPTWRKNLMSRVMDEELHTPMWVINDDFAESSYFKFYNELINSKKLIENAKKYGYKICFMPHTMVLPKIHLFDKNPEVTFFDLNKSCREVFAESNLMLTDYSSVAFDFAYLEKPVVYCQFDREEFFAGHSYSEGYFDYERDGFGEVIYNLDDTVDMMIEYMKNECQLKSEYKKRANEFFAFQDKDCCKRICDRIIENDEFFH